MAKKPFTSVGVQALQQELYALPDDALHVEASAARDEFQEWLLAHFELTDKQMHYIETLDSDFVEQASGLVSHYVGHRLPMSLNAETPPEEDEGRGKLILFNESQQVVYRQLEGSLATGHLQVTIRYPKNR
ncbi:hypothetical protein [Parapedobacter defluvii]|uniref:hypothetical protein n=1 Tax=Parapedobacter defluvii TaxID=2045106 RepID=UPI00334197E5